jgi:hypothetical protein
LAAVADQGGELGKSFADSFEADVGSAEGSHSVSSDSFFDVALGSMHEEQIMSAGSAANADNMLETNELNIDFADLMRQDLAIVAHAGHSLEHGRDDNDAVDSDAIPLSFFVPQTILTSGVTGMFYTVPTPLSCVEREYTYTYSECCVLICRRFWCLYSLCYGGHFPFWSYSSSRCHSDRRLYHTGQPYH